MLFSILITSYNQEKTIRDTITSCLNQTFDDYEIVISDDGSKDNSEAIIKSFDNPNIRYFKQEKNLKEYANRNFLVENAKGKYVTFIDAEDIIYPHALETYAYYLNIFRDIGMIITFKWDDRIIYPLRLTPRDLYRFEFFDQSFFGGNFTNLVFKRESVIKAGLFRTDIKSGDTYMQLKLALTEPGLIISNGLAWWRRSSGQVTEKLIPDYSEKDYSHLANTINYQVEMLNHPDCPLDANEIKKAKINIYGGCLRIALRWLIKLQFSKIYYLFKELHIPSEYYKAAFIPSKRNYFCNFSGDNPLQTSVNN